MQQRTVFSNRQVPEQAANGAVTVAAFGMQRTTPAGKSVADTLNQLGLAPQPYQSIRVGGEKISDLAGRTLAPGEIVTVTNQVQGGGG